MITREEMALELTRRERASDRRRREAVRALHACADRAAYVGLRAHPFLALGGTVLGAALLGRVLPRRLPGRLLDTGLRVGSGLVTRLASGGIL